MSLGSRFIGSLNELLVSFQRIIRIAARCHWLLAAVSTTIIIICWLTACRSAAARSAVCCTPLLASFCKRILHTLRLQEVRNPDCAKDTCMNHGFDSVYIDLFKHGRVEQHLHEVGHN